MDLFYVGFATLVVATGVTWMATPGVIRLARLLGAVDLPGGRKIHSGPIPRLGGVAVFLGFFAGMLFAAYATGILPATPEVTVDWRGLAIAAAGMLVVGAVDDLWGLSFKWKLAAQVLAAVFAWQCGFRVETVTHPLGGGLDLGMLSFPFTLLWIVAITNAVNLIDGLDGLAAGIALITTGTVALIAFDRGLLGVTAASVALAGSLIGFLRYNFNPARIFLGDSGSLFLGFVLAVTSVRGSQKGPTAVAILVPMLVLGLPLLDTGLAVVRRVSNLGRQGIRSENTLRHILQHSNRVFLPDRGHIHHRLLDLGLSHRNAVLVLYAVGGLFACSAFALVLLKSLWVASLLLAVLVAIMAAFILLLYIQVWRQKSRPERGAPADGTGRGSVESYASPSSQIQSR